MYSFYDCVHLQVPRGSWISINTTFIFYQAVFKLVTKEFSSSVIRDLYWLWILEQPHSLYQVCECHQFLVTVLRHFKPPGDGVYHFNGF